MRRYRFLAEALADLDAGVHFYLERADYDPAPAVRFEAAVHQSLAEIREAPTRWPEIADAPEVRRCLLARPFHDWALVYATDEEVVVIVAVAHGRRRPGYWRGRM